MFTSFLEIYIYIYIYIHIIGLGGVGNLHEIPKFMKYIIKKKKCAKENNHTRQYLHDSTICLHPRRCSDFTIH